MEEEIFVAVYEQNINNNNIKNGPDYPFHFYVATTNEPFVPLSDPPKGRPVCDFCYRVCYSYFPSFRYSYCTVCG